MNLHDLSYFLEEQDEKILVFKLRFDVGGEEVSLITWKRGFTIYPRLYYDFERETNIINLNWLRKGEKSKIRSVKYLVK